MDPTVKSRSPHAGKAPERLLIVGDSMSLGAGEVRGNDIIQTISPSFVDLVRAEFSHIRIDVNADVNRTTTVVREAIAGLLEQFHPDVVLLAIGGNDADLNWRRYVLSEGAIARNRVAVEGYEKNLRETVRAVSAAGAKPILTDLPNHHYEMRGPYISKLIGKDITSMMQASGGQAESDKRLALYRDAARRISADTGNVLVRYGEALETHDPGEVLGQDGAHLTAAGHRVVADMVMPVLSRIFRPRPTELSA